MLEDEDLASRAEFLEEARAPRAAVAGEVFFLALVERDVDLVDFVDFSAIVLSTPEEQVMSRFRHAPRAPAADTFGYDPETKLH